MSGSPKDAATDVSAKIIVKITLNLTAKNAKKAQRAQRKNRQTIKALRSLCSFLCVLCGKISRYLVIYVKLVCLMFIFSKSND